MMDEAEDADEVADLADHLAAIPEHARDE
jgi:hypothetical protein